MAKSMEHHLPEPDDQFDSLAKALAKGLLHYLY